MNGKEMGSWQSLVGMEAKARKVAPWWWQPKAWETTWREKTDNYLSTRKIKADI